MPEVLSILLFVAGFAAGALFGVFAAPAVELWLARREWRAASRELELTDRLLLALGDEDDAGPQEGPVPGPRGAAAS